MRLLNNGWLEVAALPKVINAAAPSRLTLINTRYIRKIARWVKDGVTMLDMGKGDNDYVLVSETVEQIREILCK